MLYFKVYPLQKVIAACLGMSQGRANEWIHKLSPILESALGVAPCLPERNPQNLEPVLALCASVDLIIDGTERPVQRPSDAIEQKDQYSGKNKHPLKTNLIIDIEERLVRYLIHTAASFASFLPSEDFQLTKAPCGAWSGSNRCYDVASPASSSCW